MPRVAHQSLRFGRHAFARSKVGLDSIQGIFGFTSSDEPNRLNPARQLLPPWEPYGQALLCHFKRFSSCAADVANGVTEPLLLWSDLRPKHPDRIPTSSFFLTVASMPPSQRKAIEMCLQRGGRVLDIGAGAGSHALALSSAGLPVDAIDVCGPAVEVMRARGVSAELQSMWDLTDAQRYQTIVLMMNTIGSVGSIGGLLRILKQMHKTTSKECEILLDISTPDWAAVKSAIRRRAGALASKNVEHGRWVILQCRLSFGEMSGSEFPLLYLESHAIEPVAASAGWKTSVVLRDDGRNQALIRLSKTCSIV